MGNLTADLPDLVQLSSAGHMAETRLAAPSCISCGSSHSAPFLNADPYSILQCDDCTLRFLWPQPGADEQTDLYSENYFRSADGLDRGYAEYIAQADNHRATFRDRLRYLPAPAGEKRLLDLGAAAGFFVEQAAAIGWRAQGLELSKWAADYAKEVVGVPVGQGTLRSARYADHSFDAVTMWEVIEHLPDPRTELAEIRRILRPGGMLHLSTPDAGSTVARVAGKRWLGWRKIPEHLFYFDLPSLRQLLSSEGFEITSHRYVSLVVTWQYALQRLGAMLGTSIFERIPAAVSERPVHINCYYDLMISARVH
jgi:2-polyprenyl-3-methyl-5-hydroxy-6-metoxy-1,4-benzoquinol methylase